MTRKTWTDENGVLRTTSWPQSDAPPTSTIIIQRGKIVGAVIKGPVAIHVAQEHSKPVTPANITITRDTEETP